MIKTGITILLLGLHYCVFAQGTILDWNDFRTQVAQFHPLSVQAGLMQSSADAILLSAKGGFDLKTFADVESKRFNNKTYYTYADAGLKLPTSLFGLELKTSYNYASGTFLNQENGLPANGQATVGLNWTLAQGFLIDERRANLRIAEVGLAIGLADRNRLLNELFYDAAKVYWTWVTAYNQVRIIQDALVQARIRHEGIRESYIQGDKPAIDTLETFIQLQTRQIDLNFARLDLNNALLQMQVFYWNDQQIQIPFPQNSAAPNLLGLNNNLERLNDSAVLLVNQALQQHPELAIYRAKAAQLNTERQLKREKLKPVLDLNYNLLGNGWTFFPSNGATGLGILANDIKWGVNFSMPITNRKARGEVELAKIKIIQNELYILQKQAEIDTKVRQYYNELVTLRGQIDLFSTITANNRALLDGENQKFILGESTVFLINIREQRWLDAQLKYLKLLSEYRKVEAGLIWAMGGNL